jgi:hypothetical protein
MKNIVLASVFCFCAAAVSAADKPDFSDLGFSAQLNAVTAQAQAVRVPEAAPVPARTGRYVQVSGYVNLNGTGWLNASGTGPSYTSVTLTGWATFRDSAGEVTSNNVYINVPASLWITPNQYVFQTVYPNVYAQFTYKGKPAGSANMSGSISVSGWPSGSMVSLSGSGYLSGSVYVEDAQ